MTKINEVAVNNLVIVVTFCVAFIMCSNIFSFIGFVFYQEILYQLGKEVIKKKIADKLSQS